MKNILLSLAILLVLCASAQAEPTAIQRYTAPPRTLTVPVGTKITCAFHGDVPDVLADTQPNARADGHTPVINNYSFTFKKPGTYQYACPQTPQTIGVVTVTAN